MFSQFDIRPYQNKPTELNHITFKNVDLIGTENGLKINENEGVYFKDGLSQRK